jgi:hypothetical protein
MAVLMQLFSVPDLSLLTPAQLEELRACVGAHTRTPQAEAIVQVRSLVATEYLHLTGRYPSTLLPVRDPTKPLLAQILPEEDLAHLDASAYTRLQWMAECALTHAPAAVEVIRAEAHRRFTAWTHQTPQGPDIPALHRRLAAEAVG